MTEAADRIIDALRGGHDHLAAVVHRLTAADLTRPSGASEWDVSQVLSHLGSGAEIGLAGVDGSCASRSVWCRVVHSLCSRSQRWMQSLSWRYFVVLPP